MDLSFQALFAPNLEYRYFNRAVVHPFDHHSQHFSLVNAGWLADCSLLVYVNDVGFVTKILNNVGLQTHCIGFEQSGAQCLVAHDDDKAIVCFRGTEVEEWEDLLADADIVPETVEHSGQVHRGFLHALDSIWPRIEDVLSGLPEGIPNRKRVWFSGHSLGAAMATLAADRCDAAHALYTYGSPRVGDKAFRQLVRVNAYRFVNNNDGVTTVPLVPYRHIGAVKYLGADHKLIDDPSLWTRFKEGLTGHLGHIARVKARLQLGDLASVPFDQLADHSPTSYATYIWENVEDS